MKDTILANYNIPLIRFKTTGSDKENKLKVKLNEVLGY